MALPRKQLQERLENITPENVQATLEWILAGHTATVDALKEERDTLKSKADTVESLTRERDDALAKLAKAGDAAKVQAEFDQYKAGVERDALNTKKRAALDTAFEAAGVKRDTFRKTRLKAWDLDKVELDESGAVKDMESLTAAVKQDYADFVATEGTAPAPQTNPPTGGKTAPKDPFEKGFDE